MVVFKGGGKAGDGAGANVHSGHAPRQQHTTNRTPGCGGIKSAAAAVAAAAFIAAASSVFTPSTRDVDRPPSHVRHKPRGMNLTARTPAPC